MRWVHWDEKPAWFNNTALGNTYSVEGHDPELKEIEAHSRPRFTVETTAMSCTYELLERTLRPAGEDYESQVVYVDISRSGPIDPAVAELIESRGHVLLMHGGGTTVDAQPNDTNLHATLRDRMRGLSKPA